MDIQKRTEKAVAAAKRSIQCSLSVIESCLHQIQHQSNAFDEQERLQDKVDAADSIVLLIRQLKSHLDEAELAGHSAIMDVLAKLEG